MAKKILLIDDEPLQLKIVKNSLNSKKYEFVTASDGEEGIDKVISENPDLIIVDLIMPKKDGFEFCKALRDRPETSGTPIIMLSGFEADKFNERANFFGADTLLKKPFDLSEFKRTVKEALRNI